MGSLFSKHVSEDMGEVQRFVDELIASKKIVVISKSWCIYCKRTRRALSAYPLKPDVMGWIDINRRSDGKEILNYMEQITGSRAVPRIFIGGEFFGGCNEICAAKKDGVLEHKLSAIGAI
uniref:Glutaredoxin domain-containing protein n=1 Tax=Elaeophora elaphi TaxID=1147741 RepID=A0A0R3RU53_9BILA